MNPVKYQQFKVFPSFTFIYFFSCLNKIGNLNSIYENEDLCIAMHHFSCD